jgi:predicted regulator of Ras-like GTPase activity (Roadblock/LC7/MglB family)
MTARSKHGAATDDRRSAILTVWLNGKRRSPMSSDVGQTMDSQETTEVLRALRMLASARAVFIVDDLGEVVAFEGEPDFDAMRLGELAVTRIGGIDGLIRQVGQTEAGVLFHDVPGQDIYLASISDERILAILFDQHKTSLGAVRRQVKAHLEALLLATSSGE